VINEKINSNNTVLHANAIPFSEAQLTLGRRLLLHSFCHPHEREAQNPVAELVALLHLADDLPLLVLCALFVGDGLVQQRIEALAFRLYKGQSFWPEISL